MSKQRSTVFCQLCSDIYKAQLTQNLLSNQATVPVPKSVGNVFALAQIAWIPIKITWFFPWNVLINGYGINGTKTEIHTISNFTWNWRIYPDFTTVSHWSRDFVMNNRKLLGLKGTSVWAELHTLPQYWQWTIFLLHFENSVFNSVFPLF